MRVKITVSYSGCWIVHVHACSFVWCQNPTPCSEDGYGLIYESEYYVECDRCKYSYCRQCKLKWEPEHQNKTCEEFKTWKRENSEEYRQNGMAGFPVA